MNYNNQKFYTCRYDRPFKEIMLKKENEDLLKWFLEDILKISINSIAVNTIEMNAGNIHVRRKYADIMLKTDVGKIEIEVNACMEPYVYPRNMAYICNIYTNHTLVGESYNENVPIIQINFSYGMSDKEKMRVYKLQDKTGKVFVENFQIYEINMEYYKKIWHNGNKKEIEANKYYIMLDLEKDDLKKLSEEDKVVEKYMDELEKVNENPEFRAFMTVEEDERKIFNSRLEEAERQGMERGMERGIERGLEQGRKESSLQIAKNMLSKGIDINTIIACTGLRQEDLENLNRSI